MTCSETFDLFESEHKSSLFAPERMSTLDASQVGTVGEYLVAAIVSGYGYEVHHTKCNGYDLLVMIPNRAPIRIDVKTLRSSGANRTYSIRKGKTTTFRDYSAGDCDLFALVCLEDMSVLFDRCDKYDGKSSVYINRHQHKNTCPHQSWVDSIASILP